MFSEIKTFANSLLGVAGYRIVKKSGALHRTHPDIVSMRTLSSSDAYDVFTTFHPVYSPWIDSEVYNRYAQGTDGHTLVTPDRRYQLIAFAMYAAELDGAFAECGVYHGGTALLLARIVNERSPRKLYLFDSFKGLPEASSHDNYYGKGCFNETSESAVRQLLSEYEDVIKIKAGWIPETFQDLDANMFSFVHIDVDLYQSALDCCSYFYPRMAKGGIMIFDDYGFPSCQGEKKAVDEYFSHKLENPIALPTGQGLVVKV